jgi:hypothetical protein
MDGYAEGNIILRLFDDMVKFYSQRAELRFTSSDGKYLIYKVNSR